MPDTYSQIIVHVVFAVRNRKPLIKEDWEDELYKYMIGIIGAKGQKLLAINGMNDHVHLLLGLTTDCRLSDLIRELKKSTNKFIRERKLTGTPFYWQEGFGAFSVGKRPMGKVIE